MSMAAPTLPAVAAYFAYGSNLLPGRLEERLGPCELLGAAALGGHRLAFHKRGADGSAKCDAHFTGRTEHRVLGVMYALDPVQLQRLDEFEGAGYHRVQLELDSAGSTTRTAWLYRARDSWIDASLEPWDWYHALVVAGAREHGFPDDYLEGLLTAAVRPDPDAARAAHHWQLAKTVNAADRGPLLPSIPSRIL